MGAYDVANFDPRGMIGRIYVGYHLTLLHTKYTGFWLCGFREEVFFMFSHYKPLGSLGRGLFGPQGHGRQDLIIKGFLNIVTHKK